MYNRILMKIYNNLHLLFGKEVSGAGYSTDCFLMNIDGKEYRVSIEEA